MPVGRDRTTGSKEDVLSAFQCFVGCLQRAFPTNQHGKNHVGENHDISQGKHREGRRYIVDGLYGRIADFYWGLAHNRVYCFALVPKTKRVPGVGTLSCGENIPTNGRRSKATAVPVFACEEKSPNLRDTR